jgi:hypothetical protein
LTRTSEVVSLQKNGPSKEDVRAVVLARHDGGIYH